MYASFVTDEQSYLPSIEDKGSLSPSREAVGEVAGDLASMEDNGEERGDLESIEERGDLAASIEDRGLPSSSREAVAMGRALREGEEKVGLLLSAPSSTCVCVLDVL